MDKNTKESEMKIINGYEERYGNNKFTKKK